MEKQNKKIKLIVLAVLVILIGSVLFYNFSKKNRSEFPKKSSIAVYRGSITKLDLSAMESDGDGILEISSASKLKPFHISSGESSCDPQAIKVPVGLAVGKDVEIIAKLDSWGNHLSICEKGTYIKVLQSEQ